MIVTRKLLYKSVLHLNMYKKKLPRFILQKVELTWLSHSEQEFHLTTHGIVSLLAVTLAERTKRECCFSLVLVLIVCLVFFLTAPRTKGPRVALHKVNCAFSINHQSRKCSICQQGREIYSVEVLPFLVTLMCIKLKLVITIILCVCSSIEASRK